MFYFWVREKILQIELFKLLAPQTKQLKCSHSQSVVIVFFLIIALCAMCRLGLPPFILYVPFWFPPSIPYVSSWRSPFYSMCRLGVPPSILCVVLVFPFISPMCRLGVPPSILCVVLVFLFLFYVSSWFSPSILCVVLVSPLLFYVSSWCSPFYYVLYVCRVTIPYRGSMNSLRR